ncbi:winged helix-turn-helix transcriptional regulator, partial [bacterium]|nr:winged helix-turn-helix transcriptional regulator [bacterium]
MGKLERLFGSKTRVKLLSLFLLNPERSFFVREITRKLNKRINAVRRELEILFSLGLLKKKKDGRKTFYTTNPKYIFFEELKSMLEKGGTGEDKTTDIVKKFGKVSFAAWSGIFTGNEKTKVDLIIVGNNLKKDKVKDFVIYIRQKNRRRWLK